MEAILYLKLCQMKLIPIFHKDTDSQTTDVISILANSDTTLIQSNLVKRQLSPENLLLNHGLVLF